MATTQNFTIYAGDSETLPMTLTGYDGVTALDLSAVNDIRVLFKQRQSDPDDKARIIKVLTRGVTVVNATLGKIEVHIDPADTQNITSLLPLAYSAVAFWFAGDRITGFAGTLTVQTGAVLNIS